MRLPLNALRAFEATARLGSMSAAAAELGVTHGAVSRHVKALEVQFGLLLLERLPRSVATTKDGAQLAIGLGGRLRADAPGGVARSARTADALLLCHRS